MRARGVRQPRLLHRSSARCPGQWQAVTVTDIIIGLIKTIQKEETLPTTVVNRRTGEPYTAVINMRDRDAVAQAQEAGRYVRIDRRTKWGNPYKISKARPREECIRLYRELVLSRPDLLAAARNELCGKVLGCWCKPLPCHGDVLAELADDLPPMCPKHQIPCVRTVLAYVGNVQHRDAWICEACSREIVLPAF